MNIKGEMYVCDRCGYKEFFEYNWIGVINKDAVIENPSWMKFNSKDLCPKCTSEYNNIVKEYFKNKG